MGEEETRPFWRQDVFVGLFGDCYVENTELAGGHVGNAFQGLAMLLKRVVQKCDKTPPPPPASTDDGAGFRESSLVLLEGPRSPYSGGISMARLDFGNGRNDWPGRAGVAGMDFRNGWNGRNGSGGLQFLPSGF